MKIPYIFLIFLILIVIISSSSISFAEDFHIQRWIIEANLLKNGDLKVLEDISFNFTSNFNEVYRHIVWERMDSIEDLSVSEVTNGQAIPYREVDNAKKADKNNFTSRATDKDLELKIFAPSMDEIKTFRIQYLLKNVAIKHSDTGEFHYKFLGQRNNTPIDYLSINLHLPSFDRNKISIFAHGSQQARIYFSDETVKTEVNDIKPNEFIDNRILFPLEYILTSNNIGNKDFNLIIEEERSFSEKLEKEREEKEEREKFLSKFSIYFILLAFLFIFFILYKLINKKTIFRNRQISSSKICKRT